MAAGLERSSTGSCGLYGVGVLVTDVNIGEVLPVGFLGRTKEREMVWPSWAPQTDILSHRAIGGFVTHGSRNSCLKSLWSGVPDARVAAVRRAAPECS